VGRLAELVSLGVEYFRRQQAAAIAHLELRWTLKQLQRPVGESDLRRVVAIDIGDWFHSERTAAVGAVPTAGPNRLPNMCRLIGSVRKLAVVACAKVLDELGQNVTSNPA
jgi:hypothetical protein